MSPVASFLLLSTLLSVAGGSVTAQRAVPAAGHALLDVPYVSQTPALCGGAAVAMVLRYWGEREVFAQDFASLVSGGDGGILTGTLVSAVRGRGWQALVPPAGDDEARGRIQSAIERGRPPIALIEVAPRTYHYVVIIGSTEDEVVLHDPARSPFRVLRWAAFDRAWMAAGRWMMLILPPDRSRAADAVMPPLPTMPAIVPRPERSPCAALVERSVEMALAGDSQGAEHGLLAATVFCPADAATWNELAGLRFSQSRWLEAEATALVATRLAPRDPYAWQVLATSRYLRRDVMGALEAWNGTNGPRIDSIQIHGAERTPHPVVVRATGLEPRQVLTRGGLERALRRVRDIPIVTNTRISYEPMADGPAGAGGELASVNVSIDERKALPSGLVGLATLGARALVLHELRADVAGVFGAGEVQSVVWRWSANRPRVAVSLALPSPFRLPGVVSVEGSWERQSYAAPSVAVLGEGRRRAGLRVSDWLTRSFRWQASGAIDHLSDPDIRAAPRAASRRYFAAEGVIDVRLADDRIALGLSGGSWAPLSGGNRLAAGSLVAAWRSTADTARPFWFANAAVEAASEAAPLALWSGTDTDDGRGGLLRAHPLRADGIVSGEVFGRRVTHASLEYARPMGRIRLVGLSIAGFMDTAKAWRRLEGLDSSALYVDAGMGVRVRAPGLAGAIRIDIAHGLRGGGTTLSAGWRGEWPR